MYVTDETAELLRALVFAQRWNSRPDALPRLQAAAQMETEPAGKGDFQTNSARNGACRFPPSQRTSRARESCAPARETSRRDPRTLPVACRGVDCSAFS